MSPSCERFNLVWLAILALVAVLHSGRSAVAQDIGLDDTVVERVYDVEVNTQTASEMLVVLRDGADRIWLDETDYSRLRLRVPEMSAVTRGGRRYVPLASIPGLAVSIDEPRQRLLLTAPAEAFLTTRVGLAPRETADLTRAGTGAFLNYQVSAERIEEDTFGGGFGELGVFTPKGVVVQTGIARVHESERRAVRLDTTYTRDFHERMQRLSIGDTISDGGAWGSSVRFAGIGWGKNFALRPDLLTTPLLSAAGNAVVPSTVDVYVNNQRVSSEALPPGPFVIERLPSVTGAGQVSVVVRDALGREQLLTRPFYSSTRLLAPELSQFQVDLGVIREDYTLASNRYGEMVGSATWRRGLTSSVTIEAHAEYLTNQAEAGGITLAAGLGPYGVLNLTAASGSGGGDSGVLIAAGIERQSALFNWALSSSHASEGYRQISTAEAPDLQFRRRNLAQVGANLNRFGSVALALIRQEFVGRDEEQVISFGYSKSVMQQGAVNLTATRTTVGGEEAYGAFLSYTMALGGNRGYSVTASGGSGPGSPDDELYASYSKNAPLGSGQGYRMSASTAGNYDAQWRNQTAVGDLAVSAARYSGISGVSADWTGAATLLEGQLNPARRVSNSFALVNVGGLSNVPVYMDNQLVTHTDDEGWAVLHDLRAYEPNRISVEPREVPLDTTIESRLLVLAPTYRSGVIANFPVERVKAGTFSLMTTSGSPVPAGAVVQFRGKNFPVAFEGVTYVTGFTHGMAGEATWAGNRCVFRLDGPPVDDPLPDMGRVVCTPVALRESAR